MSNKEETAQQQLFKIALHSLCTGCSFYFTKLFLVEDKLNKEEVQRVKNAFHKIEEYEPDELIKKLENLYKKEKSTKKYIDCGKFFVKGVISCDQPISSFKDHNVKLVYSRLRKFDLVATVQEQKVLDHSRQFKSCQEQYASVFELKPTIHMSGNKQYGKCFIENIKKSRLGEVTQFIASEETSLFPSINFATLGVGSIIKIGFDQNEYGIKIGDKITVYGKVLFDQIEKVIKFENPQNLLSSKAEYENYISEMSFASLGVVLFGALTLFEAYNFGMSIYHLLSNNKSNKN